MQVLQGVRLSCYSDYSTPRLGRDRCSITVQWLIVVQILKELLMCMVFEQKIPQMSNEDNHDDYEADHEVVTQEAKPQVKKPPMYRVVLLNDDYTPMDFVVAVLMMFFSMDQEKATQVMLSVHTQGKGVCGIFTRDVAETKAAIVNQYARDNSHPLLCEVEKV